MISIAILGHGVVGSGVAEILMNNAEGVTHKAGQPVCVKQILDLRTFPELSYADRFTTNFDDILQDEEIAIVVETMGGLHPAYDFVKASLLAGKSVVTSNKELVAAKGDELLAIARERNLNFLFEASVGGGIPILRPLDQCLSANRIEEVAGILNGTTNFMLTKMIREGMSFEEALSLAQQLGYAERDPSADIEGHDACRKICILAALAFGRHVYPESVYTEGITAITATDVRYASAVGGVIKLIGRTARREDGSIFCMVSPMVLPRGHMLANVDDVFNGITVKGDSVGDTAFIGRGAGKLPTASAVVADVIDEVRHIVTRKPLFWEAAADNYVADHRLATGRMLLRFSYEDKPAAVQAITDAFGPVSFIEQEEGQLAFISPAMTEGELMDAVTALPHVTLQSRLRMFDC